METKIAIYLNLLAIALLLGVPSGLAEPTEASSDDGSTETEPSDSGLPCYAVDYGTSPPQFYEVPC